MTRRAQISDEMGFPFFSWASVSARHFAGVVAWIVVSAATAAGHCTDANRLAYLHGPTDPYYPGTHSARLVTPQWIGEDGVQAVVILSIDDMRDPGQYEEYLRPILQRLKKIDGRAPVSIMTCSVDPNDPRLQVWLDEGLSIECHTIDHPCPLLQGGDFGRARDTYNRCVDLLHQVPRNTPVAFRMPCCDSRNTPSPRFWSEVFARSTPQGNRLRIDSSVFCLFTSADRTLPRELVMDSDGAHRFKKYIPFPYFVNTIENYPFPYMIDGQCWEFPCMVPSDWQGQNLLRPNNPRVVDDWKRALDATVIKQGVFTLVFHPHGWIGNHQIVELIDYADQQYGQAVKFLTFSEAGRRLVAELGDGGQDSAARPGYQLVDLNGDGFLDLLQPRGDHMATRTWSPGDRQWKPGPSLPAVAGPTDGAELRFGVTGGADTVSVLCWKSAGESAPLSASMYCFDTKGWVRQAPVPLERSRFPHGIADACMRDLDADGICELLVWWTHLDSGSGAGTRWARWGSTIFRLDAQGVQWQELPFSLPEFVLSSTRLPGRAGLGLRFVDIDGDKLDDLLFSDSQRYSAHLFESMETGWSKTLLQGRRDAEQPPGIVLPMFVRSDDTDNGAWFHSQALWVQNEDTASLPDGVQRVSFQEIMRAQSRPDAR